jgi:ABC-type phosphate transport system substrate-binding protein
MTLLGRRKSMTKLKQLTSALVLTLAVAVAVFGGTIDTPAPPPPPPAPPSAPADIGISGDIHIPGSPSDSATVAALNLLQNLLSVF